MTPKGYPEGEHGLLVRGLSKMLILASMANKGW